VDAKEEGRAVTRQELAPLLSHPTSPPLHPVSTPVKLRWRQQPAVAGWTKGLQTRLLTGREWWARACRRRTHTCRRGRRCELQRCRHCMQTLHADTAWVCRHCMGVQTLHGCVQG